MFSYIVFEVVLPDQAVACAARHVVTFISRVSVLRFNILHTPWPFLTEIYRYSIQRHARKIKGRVFGTVLLLHT